MTSSLIRGKYVICKVTGRDEAQVIDDGAVFQRDGTIVEVGPYDELASKHRPDEILGSAEHLVLPGLVNSHHHVGLTTVQLGATDDALELWLVRRMAARDVDPYLDTLYSAFELIESGVTTVQHIHGRARGPIENVERVADRILKAYQDIGMRVSYSYMVRDQNRLVLEDDEAFVARLPESIAPDVADFLRGQAIPLEDLCAWFEALRTRYDSEERVEIQLAPANLHWCSDRALAALHELAMRHRVGVHMHLVETAYQKEYARRRGGTTALRYLHERGLLGSHLTLGHGVWLSEEDVELAAETGTMICHNPSSNLRLRSGVAPVNRFLQHGVRVALGMDEAGINDDRDMLQEMRLALRLHRKPGVDDVVPTPCQIFQMATENGACTTPFGDRIGTLEPGKAADLMIVAWEAIAYPYLDSAVTPVDALVQRARSSSVETVLVAGEPILRDGRFTRLNKEDVLREIATSLDVPLRPEEERRRELSRELLPHVRRFYDGYFDSQAHEPFYRMSSRT
jgi:5-methylthioadenosine/S-adenosylhomocysteine deaminase